MDAEDLVLTWQQRLAAVTSNTNALSSAESTQRIRIRAREGAYAGVTRQRAEAALAGLSALSDGYLLLARVVDEAAQALRGSLFETRESKHDKVLALLAGPSIERTAGAVPLSSRTLLGAAVQRDALTPDDLLAQMQQAFGTARDALAEIDHAEAASAAALAQLRQDYANLEARAARIGAAAERPSLIELQGLQADPLNAQAGIEAMGRGLVAWASSLDRLEHTQAEAARGVAQAKASLATLRQLSVAFDAQCAQARQLLGDGAAAAWQEAPALPIDMLAHWYETLARSVDAGQWDAATVGLSRFHAAVGEAIERANRALAEVRAQCAEVDELSGRFTALKAKERALGMPTGQAMDCHALRERIAASLSARPIDLDAARLALRQYQDLLLAPGR